MKVDCYVCECTGKVECDQCRGKGRYGGLFGFGTSVCVTCSGTGTVECTACLGRGCSVDEPRRPRTSRVNGFEVPGGSFTTAFADKDTDRYYAATDAIEAMAGRGNRSGLGEIEAFIRCNSKNDALKFHKPSSGRMVQSSVQDADRELTILISRDQHFEDPETVQRQFAVYLAQGRKDLLGSLLTETESRFGFVIARKLELLFSHYIAHGKYLSAKR